MEHTVTEQVAKIYLAEAFSGEASDADVLVLGFAAIPADQATAAAGGAGARCHRGLG